MVLSRYTRGGRRQLLGAGLGLLGGGLPAVVRAFGETGSVCGNAPHPGYPSAGHAAVVQSWVAGGRLDGPLPDCSAMRQRDLELLVRVTASFQREGDLDDQLAHFGAASSLKGMPYWSFTDRKRQVLVRESFAVDQATSTRPRPDFTAGELKRGEELFFVHNDNRSTTLVPFGLRLVQHTPDSLLVRVENLGDIRYLGFTMVAAREMQWAVWVERLGGGRWGYRSLLGLHRLRMGRTEQHRLSNLSRAVAMYDLMSGSQTDIEPYR
jgi:hypothetical protein